MIKDQVTIEIGNKLLSVQITENHILALFIFVGSYYYITPENIRMIMIHQLLIGYCSCIPPITYWDSVHPRRNKWCGGTGPSSYISTGPLRSGHPPGRDRVEHIIDCNRKLNTQNG